MNGARAIGRCHRNFDACADRRVVGFGSLQFQFDPMVLVAGVQKQRTAGAVAGIGAAQLDEDFLVTVVVEVRKADAMAFLQVAEPSGGRDVLKKLAVCIPEHALWHDRREARFTGAEIKVEPSVVIQVPKITAHRQQYPIQSHRFSYVAECAVVIVVINLWRSSIVRQAEKISGDMTDISHAITTDEQILPAVIIVVEEPRRKTGYRFTDFRVSCYIAELPIAGSVAAIIMKEAV